MYATWKKNKNLDPNIILSEIERIKQITSDGRIQYVGDTYHESIIVIQNMIKFKKDLDISYKDRIISAAIRNIAIREPLEKEKVINEINELIKSELTSKEYIYHILTSISLTKPFPFKNIRIDDCSIRIFDREYPKKYTGRNELIQKYNKDHSKVQNGYAKVIISVKAKSVNGAMTKAISALDFHRSILCIFSNFGWEFIGDNWSPINRIRLGSFHTIHKNDGKIIDTTLWYEPHYTRAILNPNLYSPELKVVCKSTMSKLETSYYKDSIKESLLRFVRALDERDQNVAIIRLWGALETLAAPGGAHYDLVVKRCAFLCHSNYSYHKQILEHLREYRNTNVHAADGNDHAKKICYQLQFYFRKLVFFHIENSGLFKSLDEANSFLDLPASKVKLELTKMNIEKAIELFSE